MLKKLALLLLASLLCLAACGQNADDNQGFDGLWRLDLNATQAMDPNYTPCPSDRMFDEMTVFINTKAQTIAMIYPEKNTEATITYKLISHHTARMQVELNNESGDNREMEMRLDNENMIWTFKSENNEQYVVFKREEN